MSVLSGKVAIITGAARGQGEAEAALFLAEGCRVVATDVDEAALMAQPKRDGLVPLRHDVANANDWGRVVAAALDRFRHIDILVNNAATFVPKTFQQTERADLDHHYAVNQVGVFLGMKAVTASMTEAGRGVIVNISSVAGLRGSAGAFAYAATKWAVRGMTRSAALELAASGIRVNAILPGLIDTAMMRLNPPERNAALIASIPLGRPGSVADIAAAALYLASDAAAYLTGAEIVIDGGQSA
jgi:3alpha(or 20beta)-hydroxysteroid dehydrogenase